MKSAYFSRTNSNVSRKIDDVTRGVGIGEVESSALSVERHGAATFNEDLDPECLGFISLAPQILGLFGLAHVSESSSSDSSITVVIMEFLIDRVPEKVVKGMLSQLELRTLSWGKETALLTTY